MLGFGGPSQGLHHLPVVTHLSHDRSEQEATAFLAAFKAKTAGHPPLFTSDKLPAYIAALINNYSTLEPPCQTWERTTSQRISVRVRH